MGLEELKEKPVVCISSLIRDREWILPRYLMHLYNLDYDKSKIIIYWVMNDSIDGSEKLLQNFKKEHEHEYRQIIIEKVKNKAPVYKRSIAKHPNHAEKYWFEVYSNLAALRNKVIDKVLELQDVEFLFNIDSDILVNKDDLTLLVESKCDVVAGIINNDAIRNWGKDVHQSATNILNFNEHGKVYHIIGWQDSDGLIGVECTGAIALFNVDIYKQHPDLRYSFDRQGEDISWFRKAKELGIKSFANTFVQPQHIMAEGIFSICENCQLNCKKFRRMHGEIQPEIISCPSFKEKN
jgi:cellulose synthase/poly-beta-1,6-N-acetylglucosamine synthase-like glycosyltransferase